MHFQSTKFISVLKNCVIILKYCNIGLFSIAPCKDIALNLLCLIFVFDSLIYFLDNVHYSYRPSNCNCLSFSLSKVICFPLLLAIAFKSKLESDNCCCCRNTLKSDNSWGAIKQKSYKPMHKTYQKYKAKRLRAIHI